jgi:hypothetical protein
MSVEYNTSKCHKMKTEAVLEQHVSPSIIQVPLSTLERVVFVSPTALPLNPQAP